ncbi:cupin domain-containing protein [Shewanella sp. 202IG2-18]|uniref:cupin domain-containing protein n=1 Tax=Parashewanella hymeniacidonis TaxID=2807618 RepID=UPI001961B274|nr:cupin domain-containing protein [Parashewanella hymeniacidonis]MBM7071866.1 cupin domain-containing protein [Parashewanella hymeniacidonis]
MTSMSRFLLANFVLLFSSITLAGECPEGAVGKLTSPTPPTKGHLISTEELASYSLKNEAPHLDGRRLRLRNIIFQPGGYVPLHDHNQRPAIARVTKGQLVEYQLNCTKHIVHKTDDILLEKKGVTHWVVNRSDKPAVLTVSDIVDDRNTQARFK